MLAAAGGAGILASACGGSRGLKTFEQAIMKDSSRNFKDEQLFARYFLSLPETQRFEFMKLYNHTKYPLIAIHTQVPSTGTYFAQSPVMAFSVRDCPVPSSIDEMQTIGTSASQMNLLRLLPPSIVFVEDVEVAIASMRAFGIKPADHVLISTTGLDGAQWAEDWASEYVTYSKDGGLYVRTSNYGEARGYGALLSKIASFVPGMMQDILSAYWSASNCKYGCLWG